MKQLIKNKWVIIGVGAFVFIAAMIAAVFLDLHNYLFVVIVGLAAIIGVVIIYLGWHIGSGGGVSFKSSDKDIKTIKDRVNTLIIVAGKDVLGNKFPWKMYFTHHKKPFGKMRKCENDGKFYYVHLLDFDNPNKNKRLTDMMIPDTVYLDPRKYVIPITMPADKEYWKPVPNMWQRVAPFVIVLIIIIEWIIKITTTTPS